MNEHKALNIEERLAAQRGPIMRIAADHGAHNIRIIGSVARGQANEASDIDFLVQEVRKLHLKGRQMRDSVYGKIKWTCVLSRLENMADSPVG
ncbi:MAG: nucleotidyltransferase domain-containing protein [candidate division Zixibacteria bacterium]|nr:nucleotidyltransferase domain-containing protein [candidate division Zixibacteria bacterium]